MPPNTSSVGGTLLYLVLLLRSKVTITLTIGLDFLLAGEGPNQLESIQNFCVYMLTISPPHQEVVWSTFEKLLPLTILDTFRVYSQDECPLRLKAPMTVLLTIAILWKALLIFLNEAVLSEHLTLNGKCYTHLVISASLGRDNDPGTIALSTSR
jgi:hypothetical protein